MPQNAFFPRTRYLLVSQKMMQRHFFSTLFPLSPVIFATATVLAFVLLRNSRFNFHCYTQREATPTPKLARKWCCDLSRLLAWKITKRIHLCKPASLNHPILLLGLHLQAPCSFPHLEHTHMHEFTHTHTLSLYKFSCIKFYLLKFSCIKFHLLVHAYMNIHDAL